jgi:N-acetylglucosamine repressor
MKKATRQQTKEHNSNLVLKTIYNQEVISRAEIARITSLTRTTVSDLVSDLLTQGLVSEGGFGSSIGGKPPINVKLAEDARQMVCVDLGNDEFRGAVVNLRGKVLRRHAISSHKLVGEAAVQVIYQLVDALVGMASAPLLGIGIGTPGLVDTRQGVVRQAVNRGWVNLQLKSLLSERYHLPIHLANDSHVAALAEFTYRDGRDVPNLVVIKLGEGIGSGIVLDGEIYYGDGFSAGEIGHLSVEKNGPRCTCGNYGCLESVASTQAILKKARSYMAENPASKLAHMAPSGQELTMDHIQQALLAGDPGVCALAREIGAYLGVAIANLIGILNIHKVILSGHAVYSSELIWNAALKEIQTRVLPAMAAETEVSFSRLGEDNVLLGASALLLLQELGLP